MEPLNYPQILKSILTQYAQYKPAIGEIDTHTSFDDQSQQYVLLQTGWQLGKRIHGAIVHVQIKNNKYWIEYDGTEYGIANELVDAGVPREHIVLGFRPPNLRPYTDFAAA